MTTPNLPEAPKNQGKIIDGEYHVVQANRGQAPRPNRPATHEEIDYAASMLRTMGDETLACLVECATKMDLEDVQPLVVSNFADVGEARVILVPPGTHHIPRSFYQRGVGGCYVIGLPSGRGPLPTLSFSDADCVKGVINIESGASSSLVVYDITGTHYAGLRLEAALPTVLEMCDIHSGELFSDHLMQVEYGPNIDVLNIASCTFIHGHPWALRAYGPQSYGSRSELASSLDYAHESTMRAIDAIFRPLVAFVGKLDNLLGLK